MKTIDKSILGMIIILVFISGIMIIGLLSIQAELAYTLEDISQYNTTYIIINTTPEDCIGCNHTYEIWFNKTAGVYQNRITTDFLGAVE